MTNGNKYGPRPPKVPVYRRLVHLKHLFDETLISLHSQATTPEIVDILNSAEHRAMAIYKGDIPQKDRR